LIDIFDFAEGRRESLRMSEQGEQEEDLSMVEASADIISRIQGTGESRNLEKFKIALFTCGKLKF
jgi:hypothetical protein